MIRPRHRPNRLSRALALMLLTMLLAGASWTGGLLWFVADVPRTAPSPESYAALERTDAVVVLTGGSGRLKTGLELLNAGVAHKLFVSGVYDGVEVQELLRMARQAPGEVECCIVLGYSADNTIGNAYETAGWMEEQDYHSLRLVTGNYHMRRSLLEFRNAMPDARIVPHPVIPENVRLDEWWMRRGTASLLVNEYVKYLLATVRYWLEESLES